MSGSAAERLSIDLTPAEAEVVVAALWQFEPYWSFDLDDLSRTELLADIRVTIDRVPSSSES